VAEQSRERRFYGGAGEVVKADLGHQGSVARYQDTAAKGLLEATLASRANDDIGRLLSLRR
jgi:hypothetical protein